VIARCCRSVVCTANGVRHAAAEHDTTVRVVTPVAGNSASQVGLCEAVAALGRMPIAAVLVGSDGRCDDVTEAFRVFQFLDITETATRVGELEEECRRLRQAQSISRVGSWHSELASRESTVSDTFLELYGMDRSTFVDDDEAIGRCVHPEDRDRVAAAHRRLRDTREPMSMRFRVVRAHDGSSRWLDARGIVVRDSTGAVTHTAGTIADVTELVQAEADAQRANLELRQAHSYQQAVITATPDAIHVYHVATGALSRANRSETALIGFTDETVKVMAGTGLDTLLADEDLQLLQDGFAAVGMLADGEVTQVQHRVHHEHSTARWLSRRMTPFRRDSDGRVTQVLVISRDVTDVVAVEERLRHAALHDDLTGLPNRRLIRDRLDHALKRAARGGHIAVLACDLDGFKRINDSHGHRTGDNVLTATATKLIDATRVGDTVARLGGDEFVVVLDIPQHQDPRALAEQVATRITTMIAQPVLVDDTEHTVTVSIGISIAHDTATATATATAEEILSDADTAMYHAKHHGGNGHTFFQLSQRPDTAQRDHIERQIRRALADDTLEMYYQPIINPHTNAVEAVEALLRIPDTDGTHLNTAHAIGVAEHTGLIAALDERVLQLACAQAAAWRNSHEHRKLTLHVNRSAKDITKPGFYRRINDALTISGVDPHALTLEITETVLLDADENNLADLRRLNGQGVGLAIDDFGTGYASLRYLAELPITCIKIDRSFTNALPHDATSMTLVRTTIGLAEQLAISCVVEGVETTQQLTALPQYDRLLIQGYLYAKPQPAAQPLHTHTTAQANIGLCQ
jgi:diguanylate cyclase (GGDEF)-like protein/PAS domain S-box-containing protein